jgi:NTP pyrophosphatase (non-canonical NTP hydrolase)
MTNNKNLSLYEAQKQVEKFLNERGWFPKDSKGRYYTLGHIMEELGELARCITHLESKRSEVMNSEEEQTLDNLETEIGDLLYHVFKIASAYNIDVNQAFHKIMEKNVNKFPIDKYRNFGQHKLE